MTKAFASIAGKVSKIDVLINNAGIGAQGGVEAATTEEWNKVLNINVIGTSRGAWRRACRAQQRGR